MASTLDTYILSLNPTSYWKLDETSGTTVFNSALAGTAPTGSYLNSPTFAVLGDIYGESNGGNAVRLNNGSGINLGRPSGMFESITNGSGLTIVGFINPSGYTAWKRVFGAYSADTTHNGIALWLNQAGQTTIIRVEMYDKFGNNSFVNFTAEGVGGVSNFWNNNYRMYRCEWKASGVRLWIDECEWVYPFGGTQFSYAATGISGGLLPQNTGSLILGGYGAGNSVVLDGIGADYQRIAIFNRSLTSLEGLNILRNATNTYKGIARVYGVYNASSGVYKDLAGTQLATTQNDRIMYWQDLSGNGNHFKQAQSNDPTWGDLRPIYDTRFNKPVINFPNRYNTPVATFSATGCRTAMVCSGTKAFWQHFASIIATVRPIGSQVLSRTGQEILSTSDALLNVSITNYIQGYGRPCSRIGSSLAYPSNTGTFPATRCSPGICTLGISRGAGGRVGSGFIFVDGTTANTSALQQNGSYWTGTTNILRLGGDSTDKDTSFIGFMDEVIICDRPINSIECSDYYTNTLAAYNLNNRTTAIQINGDSISSYQNSSGNYGWQNTLPRQAETFLWTNPSYDGLHIASGTGGNLSLLDAPFVGQSYWWNGLDATITNKVALLTAGTNDLITNKTSGILVQEYQQWRTAVLGAGANKLVVVLPATNSNAGGSVGFAGYRDWLRANTSMYDMKIELGALTFTDGTHPDTTGHFVMGNYIWSSGLSSYFVNSIMSALGLSSLHRLNSLHVLGS